MLKTPGYCVWESTVRESRHDDLGFQSAFLHLHTYTCDLSDSAVHTYVEREKCAHFQNFKAGCHDSRKARKIVVCFIHSFSNTVWLLCQPFCLLYWYSDIQGCDVSGNTVVALDITAISWQDWDRDPLQGRLVNHGICLNVSSERPLCFTSDTLMALTSTDLRLTCHTIFSLCASLSLPVCSTAPRSLNLLGHMVSVQSNTPSCCCMISVLGCCQGGVSLFSGQHQDMSCLSSHRSCLLLRP